MKAANQPIQGTQLDAFDFRFVNWLPPKVCKDWAIVPNRHLRANKERVFHQYLRIQIEVDSALDIVTVLIAMKVVHVDSMFYRCTKIDQKERPEPNLWGCLIEPGNRSSSDGGNRDFKTFDDIGSR